MINFKFDVSALSLCADKIYVFPDDFHLKRSIYKMQSSGLIPRGSFLTQEQFFAGLQDYSDFPLIPQELKELVFWQVCASGESFEDASDKAKRFFTFWKELNGLSVELEEIEKNLAPNQMKRWKRQLGYREKYLQQIRLLGFADDEVENFEYGGELLYDSSLVFYDCLNISSKQAKWLKSTNKEIEFALSFPETMYDKENFCLCDFKIKDVEKFSFPKIEIKRYEDKFFMDAALVNDGVRLAYGKQSATAFDIFGNDILLKDKKIFRYLSTLKELIESIKDGRIPLHNLLNLVLINPWESENCAENVLNKEFVLNLINKQYKFLPNSEIKAEFLAFIREFSTNFDFFFSYLEKLDDNSIYLNKVEEIRELNKIVEFSPLQALDYFLSKNATEIVAEDKSKVKIKPLTTKVSADSFAIYDATEGFLNSFCSDADFFSEEQKKNLGLLTKEQTKIIRKYLFFSLLTTSEHTTIYTYEEPSNNIQIASVLEELNASDLDVDFTEYNDLNLNELLSLILPSENAHNPEKEKEFVFPYAGEDLNNFSYSEVKSLLENAENYYLNCVLKIREFNLPSRSIENNLLGEIAHKIFQLYLQRGADENISEIAEKVLLQYFDKLPNNYHKIYFEKYTVETIKKSLKHFASEYKQDDGECEKSFEKYFPEHDIALRGRLDYLTKGGLYDFKTGSKNNLDPAQLEFYSLLAENLSAYFYLIFENESVPFAKKKNYQPILSALKSKIRQIKAEGFKEKYDE